MQENRFKTKATAMNWKKNAVKSSEKNLPFRATSRLKHINIKALKKRKNKTFKKAKTANIPAFCLSVQRRCAPYLLKEKFFIPISF